MNLQPILRKDYAKEKIVFTRKMFRFKKQLFFKVENSLKCRSALNYINILNEIITGGSVRTGVQVQQLFSSSLLLETDCILDSIVLRSHLE